MALGIQILIGLIVLFVLVGVIWRILSIRSSLPCPSWLAWLVEMENPYAKNYNAGDIVRLLGITPGMKVLDAGCGPGRVSIPLAKAVGPQGRVVAMDIQARMLNRAKDKAKAASLTNIDFRLEAVEAATLGSNEFDRAILVTVLGEIPDRKRALQQIRCALKPGGILSVTEIIVDPHYQSRKSIVQLGTSTGFRERAFYGNRITFTLLLEKSEQVS